LLQDKQQQVQKSKPLGAEETHSLKVEQSRIYIADPLAIAKQTYFIVIKDITLDMANSGIFRYSLQDLLPWNASLLALGCYPWLGETGRML